MLANYTESIQWQHAYPTAFAGARPCVRVPTRAWTARRRLHERQLELALPVRRIGSKKPSGKQASKEANKRSPGGMGLHGSGFVPRNPKAFEGVVRVGGSGRNRAILALSKALFHAFLGLREQKSK